MKLHTKVGHFYRERALNAMVIALSYDWSSHASTQTESPDKLRCRIVFAVRVFQIKCDIVLCTVFGCRIVVDVCIHIRPILISQYILVVVFACALTAHARIANEYDRSIETDNASVYVSVCAFVSQRQYVRNDSDNALNKMVAKKNNNNIMKKKEKRQQQQEPEQWANKKDEASELNVIRQWIRPFATSAFTADDADVDDDDDDDDVGTRAWKITIITVISNTI